MSNVEIEAGRYITRWAFWNPATWSIPKLYWDAWSQEQRLHAICRQLEKVIKYADYLGVNVDDIAARLKAIEEGQLDPIIEQAVEAWFEEHAEDITQAITQLREDVDGIIAEIGTGFDAENTIADAVQTANDAIQTETETREQQYHQFSQYVDVHKLSNSVSPVYVGDFMANEQFGCCTMHDGKIYAFMSDNYDDSNGLAKVFDIATNTLYYEKSVIVGHANSCCWDSVRQCFWIAPHATYTSGAYVSTTEIYRYDELLTAHGVLNMPNIIYGLSFDNETNTMYAIFVPESGNIIMYHMLEDENDFSEYKEIPLSLFNLPGTADAVIQDIAVNDDIAYFVLNEGTGYVIDLREEEPEVNSVFTIDYTDSGNVYEFGEVEGIEFGEDGILYNARNSLFGYTNPGKHYPINNGFVTALNVTDKAYPMKRYNQTIYNTLTLSTATQAKFCLGRAEIRSLNQLNHMHVKYSRVSVTDDVTDPNIIVLVNVDVTLVVNVKYTVERFVISGGRFGLYVVTDATLSIASTISNRAIDASAADTMIYVRNDGTIEMENNVTAFVFNQYQPNIVVLYTLNDPSSLVIGSTARTMGVYYGNAGVLANA